MQSELKMERLCAGQTVLRARRGNSSHSALLTCSWSKDNIGGCSWTDGKTRLIVDRSQFGHSSALAARGEIEHNANAGRAI